MDKNASKLYLLPVTRRDKTMCDTVTSLSAVESAYFQAVIFLLLSSAATSRIIRYDPSIFLSYFVNNQSVKCRFLDSVLVCGYALTKIL